MRSHRLPVVLLGLFLVIGRPAYAEEKIAACASNCVEGIAKALVAALTSADAEKACSVYVQSDQVLAIESSGRVHEGIKGIREMYASAFSEAKFLEVKFRVERPRP
ncbi:MAG: hypothetical protein FJ109_15945 [Deltaproteobacteria bacterium]|nr:hypothetical protein [Deltaproteobacteria bacterium]